MNALNQRLADKINQRNESSTLRSLNINSYAVDFYSNNYLGLAQKKFETPTHFLESGTGSRLISGTSSLHHEVETLLAQRFHSEAALLFNSGYDANLGLLQALVTRHDTVIYDEHIHASSRDGLVLARAKAYSFQHNNLQHLEERLQKAEGIVFVLVESLYSMHGDLADLKGSIDLCNKYGAHLIVDEAHAGACFGKNGGGRIEALGLEKEVFARLLTFGKGFGAHGAVVLSSQLVKDNLINFARSFIYTTTLPESSVYRIQQILTQTDFTILQEKLQENIAYFCALFGIPNNGSPIQCLTAENIATLRIWEKNLKAADIGIKCILPPTVKAGEERLRVCVHAFNTKVEMEEMKKILL
ncbi:8-amino-7-oxononanoate synthase [Lishizhenia tianjinensis]|uniref:8-amino-7-oxononanoate synthase n=1 Tax=Lishizhenia tianjinensis TaxID=477690 RepID=A0A1I6XJL6_9FLAO|nr:aminotransferase class I/II-fold pyridoxal phosphate-dependent enzyme [Lishizhenia tianjinensis]SFT38500.1 8-amino-7-oxononanoate synthase [Lishizhenia tianjinensis]